MPEMDTSIKADVETSIKALVPRLEEQYSCVTFIFQPLPKVQRVPAIIESQIKGLQKGRRRGETVRDYRVPISRAFLLFMEYASKGKLQLPHVIIDDISDGQPKPRMIGGKVKEDEGHLKLVVAHGRLPALRVLNKELGRLGGDLTRTADKHPHLLEKNGIDRKMVDEFVKLLGQCYNSGWGVAIERPVNG